MASDHLRQDAGHRPICSLKEKTHMPLSFHDISIPAMVRQLKALSTFLGKADESAKTRGFDSAVFVTSRLAPDMFPLSKQVQIACDIAKRGAARFAGVEAPAFEDNEVTIADLQDRIARTIAFLEGIDPAALAGDPDREMVVPLGTETHTFTALTYLNGFVLPNVYFHASIAYAILRHNGVAIGKRDFLGSL